MITKIRNTCANRMNEEKLVIDSETIQQLKKLVKKSVNKRITINKTGEDMLLFGSKCLRCCDYK